MKLLIFLILTFGQMFGQDLNDEIKDAINKMPMEEFSEIMGWDSTDTDVGETWRIINQSPNWKEITFREKLAALLQDYSEECYADTLKAILWQGEYIVDRVSYREMMSMQQLEDNGYKYKYRWFIDNNLDDCLYIFIKEPTLPGLSKWLNRAE